jgi:hypothetical protein
LCIDRAMLYNVPLDPAAGIGITRIYCCTVSVMVDIDVNGGGGGGRGSFGRRRGRGGLRIEARGNDLTNLSHGGDGCVKDPMPFVCLLSLGANVDADPVYGSYSLHKVVVVDHPSSDDNGDGGPFSRNPSYSPNSNPSNNPSSNLRSNLPMSKNPCSNPSSNPSTSKNPSSNPSSNPSGNPSSIPSGKIWQDWHYHVTAKASSNTLTIFICRNGKQQLPMLVCFSCKRNYQSMRCMA